MLLSILALSLAAGTTPSRPLLVTSRFTDEVIAYDEGGTASVFASGGGLDNPVGLTFGPDDNLYVASGDTNQVLRYDGQTGAFLDIFAEGGGLSGARKLGFGPDGNLYVASGSNSRVLRYDGGTGAFLGVFASATGLRGVTSFTFGTSGDLYVVSVSNGRIYRFDGASGANLGVFASAGTRTPHDLTFGPDGDLYVTDAAFGDVRRFDSQTGGFLGIHVQDPALSAPLGLTFDLDGTLLVANQGSDEVRRYGPTGQLIEVAVTPGSGGLDAPLFMAFAKDTTGPRVHTPIPGEAGITNFIPMTGLQPGGIVLHLAGLDEAQVNLCGLRVSLVIPPHLVSVLVADASGSSLFEAAVPQGLAGTPIYLQVLDPLVCRLSPVRLFVPR